MVTTVERTIHSVAVTLDAAQFLGGWQASSGVLFVPALSELRVGDEAAVRIGIAGQPTCATLFGRVKLVRRVGRPSLPPGVEILLDPVSLPGAQFLALAARAGRVEFQQRAPRYVVARDIVVRRGGSDVRCTTRDISVGGCAVVWHGALPAAGEVVSLALRQGIFGGAPRAVVCWTSAGTSSDAMVGLRVIAEGFAARSWRSLVADAARTSERTT